MCVRHWELVMTLQRKQCVCGHYSPGASCFVHKAYQYATHMYVHLYYSLVGTSVYSYMYLQCVMLPSSLPVTPQLTTHGRYPCPSPSPPPLGLLSPKPLARWRSPSHQRQVTGLSLRHTPPFRASRLCSVCCMMCVHIRMYTCTYVHMYTCTYVHMYTCTYVCIHAHTYICIHAHTYICIHAHTYVYLRVL